MLKRTDTNKNLPIEKKNNINNKYVDIHKILHIFFFKRYMTISHKYLRLYFAIYTNII